MQILSEPQFEQIIKKNYEMNGESGMLTGVIMVLWLYFFNIPYLLETHIKIFIDGIICLGIASKNANEGWMGGMLYMEKD